MFPDLLSQERVRDEFDEIVDGVDGRVDGLEPLDLVPDGHRRRVLLVVAVVSLRLVRPSQERGHLDGG